MALIEFYRQGFLGLDSQRLASIWDHEHDPLIYVAQEREEPIFGWAAIQGYFAAFPEHLDEVLAKEVYGIRIDALGDGRRARRPGARAVAPAALGMRRSKSAAAANRPSLLP